MLVHALDCESTNPPDKVFAVLGMLDHCQNDILNDYSWSVSQVSVQAFWKMVNVDERLDALVFSQNANREQGIPSWAPNLCSSFSAQPSRLKGRSWSLYDATRASVDKYQFLEDSNALDVLGLIFDTIQDVSQKTLCSLTPEGVDQAVSIWRPLVFNWLGSMEIDQKYERLMRILVRDRDTRSNSFASHGKGLEWETFFGIEHRDIKGRAEFDYLAGAVRRSTFKGAGDVQTELNDLATFVQRGNFQQASNSDL